MIIALDTRYRTGQRTYIYFIFKYCWWIIGLAALFCYLAYSIAFGTLNDPTAHFLASHADWYVSPDMLAQWILFVGVGFFIVAYLRVSVQYRQYSFFVDDHAFHLRRGLLRMQEITIPYKQISNVHIEQPYHWRLLGLAQLDITISSSREALRPRKRRDFLIPVIDKSLARALSRFLVEEASGYGDTYDEDGDEEDDEYDDEDDGEDVEIDEANT
ncbi:MAG TPA: PH domain-containing protein [Candidatus Paceibacterota bacterium]|nr:PH domain-containing protein [Candidatus Paceibacterota bacterium]